MFGADDGNQPLLASYHMDDVAERVSDVNVGVREVQRQMELLGGPTDTASLRDAMRSKRQAVQELIKGTKTMLEEPVASSDKMRHDKLLRQFQDVVRTFEDVCKQSMRKEREIVTLMRESLSLKEESPLAQARLSSQLELMGLDEVDEAIIQERNEDLRRLEQDLVDLAGCFEDVALMVADQGKDIDQVETHVDATEASLTTATEELHQANEYAKSARRRICIVLIIITIIVCIVVGIIVGVVKARS